ncbi:MAG: chorismate mutase [Pseudomonadota bacterium]
MTIDTSFLPAEDCRTMADVRAQIDRIDRELVSLIAERTQYIEAAARIKDHADDVRVDWRVNDVLSKVNEYALKLGVPTTITSEVWKGMVEQSIRHEGRVWHSIRGLPPSDDDV